MSQCRGEVSACAWRERCTGSAPVATATPRWPCFWGFASGMCHHELYASQYQPPAKACLEEPTPDTRSPGVPTTPRSHQTPNHGTPVVSDSQPPVFLQTSTPRTTVKHDTTPRRNDITIRHNPPPGTTHLATKPGRRELPQCRLHQPTNTISMWTWNSRALTTTTVTPPAP